MVSDEGLVGPGASGLSQVLLTPRVVAGQCGVLWSHVWIRSDPRVGSPSSLVQKLPLPPATKYRQQVELQEDG